MHVTNIVGQLCVPGSALFSEQNPCPSLLLRGDRQNKSISWFFLGFLRISVEIKI